LDLETGEQIFDAYNYTIVELSKVPFFIGKDSLSKWLFFFRYLSRLRELPPELSDKKFKQLTESSRVSKFSKEEFEAYQKMYHERWDHNVLKRGFFKEFADEVNAKVEENVSKKTCEIAKKLKSTEMSVDKISEITGLSIDEVNSL
jgi:glutamate synthase domain-containing protein 2